LQQHHFPDVIQVGDIRNWREWDIDWSSIDFIGSGSPCQDLSSIGKRDGLNGKKSSLFFAFIDILNHCKSLNPNVKFLQENVGSASKLDVGIMSRLLGVYPVRINSSLVTAQLRDRYYWSNIKTKQSLFDLVTDIPQPKDKGILLKDIITSGNVDRIKSVCLIERYIGAIPKSDAAIQRHLKNRVDFGSYTVVLENNLLRAFNKIEMCRLQGFTDNYCDILSEVEAGSLLGDGWTLPMIEHILSYLKL
jgi:site-specific DNA-cytosine methylase